jgi:hypothetical protein
VKYELDQRKLRLYKITALYLLGFLAAIAVLVASIVFTVKWFGPGALVFYLLVGGFIFPSYHLAKKKLKELEEREARVERELRKGY